MQLFLIKMPPAIFQSNEIVSNATYIHIVFLDHLGFKPVTSSFYSILFNFFLVLFVCVLFSYVFCLCYLIMSLVCVFFLWCLFLCSLFLFMCCLFVLCACITKRVRLFEFKVMCLCLDCSCVLHPLSSSSLCIRIVFLDHSLIKSRHLIFRFVSLYSYRLFRPFTDTE